MKISWWDRNLKIRHKGLVVIDEFLTVSLYQPNEFISWNPTVAAAAAVALTPTTTTAPTTTNY